MSAPLRVALLCPGIGYGGGVPRSAEFAHRALTGHGMQVDLVDLATSRQDPLSKRLLAPTTWLKSTQVSQGHEPGHWHSGAQLAELEIARYLPRRSLTSFLSRYDVAFMVSGFPAWANVMRELKIPKALQIATLSSWERSLNRGIPFSARFLIQQPMNMVVAAMDRGGVRAVDSVFAMNRKLLSWSLDVRGGSAGASLLPPGVDTDYFSPPRHWNQQGWAISVGRLGDARKGWGRLMKSYQNAATRNPSLPGLMIVGSGRLSPEDQQVLLHLGKDCRVRVRSDVTDWELRELLRQSSVFVQGSYEEGFGLAALEAMACGLPVLAADSDGPRMYVRNGETGFLLSQDSDAFERDLLAGMEKVINQYGAMWGSGARKMCVEQFSFAALANRLASQIELIA